MEGEATHVTPELIRVNEQYGPIESDVEVRVEDGVVRHVFAA